MMRNLYRSTILSAPDSITCSLPLRSSLRALACGAAASRRRRSTPKGHRTNRLLHVPGSYEPTSAEFGTDFVMATDRVPMDQESRVDRARYLIGLVKGCDGMPENAASRNNVCPGCRLEVTCWTSARHRLTGSPARDRQAALGERDGITHGKV